jgi:hypothetical protein
MDDVIVTGHDGQGGSATLEIQAKRTISFSASDEVFADVVKLACRVAAKPEFDVTRYELAVAIARTSTKIEQHIQTVLQWAREYQDPTVFFRRIGQPKVAHQAMRDFVKDFRGHMEKAGAAHDDAAVHRLLARFQVLLFDLEQQGSASTVLARERCALQLTPADMGRAGELWDVLQHLALEVDAAGGNLDASTLRQRLTSERTFRLAGDRHLHQVRERLAEAMANTIATIGTSVRGVTVDRSGKVEMALEALDARRYLEIRGAGGVGKSGVLKDIAERFGVESRVIVLAPHRIPAGGWAAMRDQLGCDVGARELLADLAGDGGGILFIDGIDRFDDPGQRATVVDLLRAAAQVKGFRVVATARLDFDSDARAWLPEETLRELQESAPLVIEELDDAEVAWLRTSDSGLAALLSSGHPAEKLARNLYRLNRLARSGSREDASPLSEAQMAWQWWMTGDSAEANGRLERQRVLHALGVHLLKSSAPLDASHLPAGAVASLAEAGTLRPLGAILVEPVHDVLRDWAVGCLLYEEPTHLDAMDLTSPAPAGLVRGVEFAARLHAEVGSGAVAWRALLDKMSAPGAHGSWRRTVLLALARSERSQEMLNRCLPELVADDAKLLGDLVRAAIAIDSQPAAPLWAVVGADTSGLTDDFVAPRGLTWFNLIAWSLFQGDNLPEAAVPQFVDLYNRWSSASGGQDPLSPLLVARLYAWLQAVEVLSHPKEGFRARLAAEAPQGLSMTTPQENDLRNAFLMWCKLCPTETAAYLQGMQGHPYRHALFRPLLQFLGTAPVAAPEAVANLFLQALPEGDDEDEYQSHGSREVFATWDLEYFPASPARPPFLYLLQANKAQGLRLVRGVIAHAVRRKSRRKPPGDNKLDVPFPTGPRSFSWPQTYMWSRGQGSSIVASALMALEAWAHLRIEGGEPVQDVVDDILGAEETPAAFLLVAVDVMLTHWPKSHAAIWPFAACPQLLAMDRQRYAFDGLNRGDRVADWVHPEPAGQIRLENLRQRSSRGRMLDQVVAEFGLNGPDEVREAMQAALRAEVARIGPPDEECEGMADPRVAAMVALNRLDPTNYIQAGAAKNGRTMVEYRAPAEEARLFALWEGQARRGNDEVVIRGQLMTALTEGPCAAELLERGLKWAQGDTSRLESGSDKDEDEWIERTRLIVAALVFRDGSPQVKSAHGQWAREQLAAAASRPPQDPHFPKQLPYNPGAIAAIGYLADYRERPEQFDLTILFDLASRKNTNMSAVLTLELNFGRELPPELGRSLIRLGFASAIYAVRESVYDLGAGGDFVARENAREAARLQADRDWLKAAVDAELKWRSKDAKEPNWPNLPNPSPARQRTGLSLGNTPRQRRARKQSRQFAFDEGAAAKWLLLARHIWRVARPDLLSSLVRHCWPWTAGANGVGMAADEEPGERPYEWNNAYFASAIAVAVSLPDNKVEDLVLQPLSQLPEERFLDAAEAVLHTLDTLWFNDGAVTDTLALSIRESVAKSLTSTYAWQRLISQRSSSTERHLSGALAAMFLGEQYPGRGPRTYVKAAGAARAAIVFPLLTRLTEESASSTFVAVAYLNLLEVSPSPLQLASLAQAVKAWWQAQGAHTEFWIDHSIGRRVCEWLEKVVLGDAVPKSVLNAPETTMIVDILVQCGTPMARSLEERIAACRRTAST